MVRRGRHDDRGVTSGKLWKPARGAAGAGFFFLFPFIKMNRKKILRALLEIEVSIEEGKTGFKVFFFYKRLGFKLHFTIYPNTIGPGFRIYHIGDFVHVGLNVRIGKKCTLLPGVVFGNKHEMADGGNISVGDNCYFGLGAKILGSVMIGNNVTVGTNAVVTKDIPDNAVVGGVPAKVIKMKILNEIKGGGQIR